MKNYIRMCNIYDENRIKFEEFAEEVLDKGIGSIEYEGKLVIFQREDLPRNPGIAMFSENLDGTNRFKDGWMSNSGTREQQMSSIALQLAGKAASTPKSPETAVFKNIFINCVPGVEVTYKGFAMGYVLLKNGEKIKVAGTSGNYDATDCAIGAQ